MGNNPSTTTKTWDEMFEIALAKLFAETFQVCQFCVGKCFRQPQTTNTDKKQKFKLKFAIKWCRNRSNHNMLHKNKIKSILLLLNTDNVICNL